MFFRNLSAKNKLFSRKFLSYNVLPFMEHFIIKKILRFVSEFSYEKILSSLAS